MRPNKQNKKIKQTKQKKVKQKIYLQNDAKSKQKEKTNREEIRTTKDKIEKGLRDKKLKRHDGRWGSHQELYITKILRISLGQSLKW